MQYRKVALALGCLILTHWAVAASELKANPKFLKQTAKCEVQAKGSAQPTLIIKLWHLAPGTNTKLLTKKPYEQESNIRDVESQIREWVQVGHTLRLVTEGCEGELKDTTEMNGWTLGELRALAQKKQLSPILTQPVFSAEAEHGDRVDSVCGDRLSLMKETLAAFSDARAALGYLSRIEETTSKPVQQKIYLDGAREAYQLAAAAPVKEIQAAIVSDLKKSIATILKNNRARSEALVAEALREPQKINVIIAGGLHADQILEALNSKKLPCIQFEPVHYSNDEQKLLKSLEGLVR